MLDLHKLFVDVFNPQPGETALMLMDTPHDQIHDNPAWEQRRAMAERWHAALRELGEQRGFHVQPPINYPATGSSNAQLPEEGQQAGKPVRLQDEAAQATLILALTEFSASAPLIVWTQQFPRLRAASMPGVAPEMESTALAADYALVARSCKRLYDRLAGADYARIGFSNGDTLTLDLRFRDPRVDDGRLWGDKEAPRLVNLPSGEAYTAVYEGERPGIPSDTRGVLPVPWLGDVIRLEIEKNRVMHVLSHGEAAEDLRNFLTIEPARCNVAELGLGCNPMARVWGSVLEDEKAGPHIALGRSEHLGGTTGPDAFGDPRYVWHHDFVYARESPIHVARMTLVDPQGQEQLLVVNGHYAAELEIGI